MLRAREDMSKDQQIQVIKLVGLTNQLWIHKLKSDDLVEGVQNNRESTLIWTIDCNEHS